MFGFDWLVYVLIGALVAGLAFAPRPPKDTITPGEIDMPTAEEGKELYVLFGTRDLRDPNVVWYGDITAQAVKKKGGKK